MFVTYNSINKFFAEQMSALPCRDITRSYIVGILSKYKIANDDYSNRSLTILYSKAKKERNFLIFQNLADYIFFSRTFFPEYLSNASIDYYQSLAQSSYYTCYKIVDKKIDIYQELADRFQELTEQTHSIIQKI